MDLIRCVYKTLTSSIEVVESKNVTTTTTTTATTEESNSTEATETAASSSVYSAVEACAPSNLHSLFDINKRSESLPIIFLCSRVIMRQCGVPYSSRQKFCQSLESLLSSASTLFKLVEGVEEKKICFNNSSLFTASAAAVDHLNLDLQKAMKIDNNITRHSTVPANCLNFDCSDSLSQCLADVTFKLQNSIDLVSG